MHWNYCWASAKYEVSCKSCQTLHRQVRQSKSCCHGLLSKVILPWSLCLFLHLYFIHCMIKVVLSAPTSTPWCAFCWELNEITGELNCQAPFHHRVHKDAFALLPSSHTCRGFTTVPRQICKGSWAWERHEKERRGVEVRCGTELGMFQPCLEYQRC